MTKEITFDWKGNVAIVTGGSQGIGFAVARKIADSGATVCVWDIDEKMGKQAVSDLGKNARFAKVDVTDYADVEKAVAAIKKEFGKIDNLVNSAGMAGMNAPVQDYPLEEWNRIFRLNMNGTFHTCRAVVPVMIENGFGRIVNIASIAGKEGNPNASAYSASKAAVIAFTKSLGKELSGHDIGVNCITPAAARTRIFDQMTEEHINYMLSKIPRNRFVLVEEIASLVCFALSRENSFTTAAVYDISGGRATY